MNIKLKSQKGTTITEMLLYMGILSILITMLTSIFVSALDVQSESNAASAVEQDGNYILARLEYDIHRAQSITVPTVLGTTANNFQIIINGISYAYNIDGNNNLVLVDDSGANNLNNYGTSISAFLVTRLGNEGKTEDALRIAFTITSRTKRISGFETKNFQTNVSLRRQ